MDWHRSEGLIALLCFDWGICLDCGLCDMRVPTIQPLQACHIHCLHHFPQVAVRRRANIPNWLQYAMLLWPGTVLAMLCNGYSVVLFDWIQFYVQSLHVVAAAIYTTLLYARLCFAASWLLVLLLRSEGLYHAVLFERIVNRMCNA
jgi:hypothetical protein